MYICYIFQKIKKKITHILQRHQICYEIINADVLQANKNKYTPVSMLFKGHCYTMYKNINVQKYKKCKIQYSIYTNVN